MTQITCDGCGQDLTTTSNSVDYRLALRNEVIPNRGRAVTDIHISPSLEKDAHFCDLICLRRWLERRP
jgi:hypothetical protein